MSIFDEISILVLLNVSRKIDGSKQKRKHEKYKLGRLIKQKMTIDFLANMKIYVESI